MPDQAFSPSPREGERPAPAAEVPRHPEAPAAEREVPAERPREAPPPPPEAPAPPAPPPPAPVPAAAAPAQARKDEVTRRVEKILEEDMVGLYMTMKPEVQRAFKAKGEETAARIRALLAQASVRAKDILKLIKDWLRLIPGVNRFFLEQEAKIKTDKIMNLREK